MRLVVSILIFWAVIGLFYTAVYVVIKYPGYVTLVSAVLASIMAIDFIYRGLGRNNGK